MWSTSLACSSLDVLLSSASSTFCVSTSRTCLHSKTGVSSYAVTSRLLQRCSHRSYTGISAKTTARVLLNVKRLNRVTAALQVALVIDYRKRRLATVCCFTRHYLATHRHTFDLRSYLHSLPTLQHHLHCMYRCMATLSRCRQVEGPATDSCCTACLKQISDNSNCSIAVQLLGVKLRQFYVSHQIERKNYKGYIMRGMRLHQSSSTSRRHRQ